ncbi:Replication factor C subunit 3 [Linum perenne]
MASPHITEEAVYLCTGNPLPKDIEQGLAIVDIVREVTILCSNRFVFRIKMPSDVRVKLINDMADIEYLLTFGCSDKLQLGSLVASFTGARSALVAAAK